MSSGRKIKFGITNRIYSTVPILVIFLCFGISSANVLTVGENPQLGSIAKAVDRSNPFDTIYVKGGRYLEHSIEIVKPLTIVGVNMPIIDASGRKVEIFVVRSNSVHISGFILQNVGESFLKELAAIKVMNSSDGFIENNIIRNCFFGIYLGYASNFILKGNTITGMVQNDAFAGNAIHIWKGNKILIKDNVLMGHRDGIYFEFVDSSQIKGNISEGNLRYGLHFMFSNNDEYKNNVFKNNGAGVAVMFSKNISMTANSFEENWGGASYGLLLKEISDGKIENNIFYRNTIGILAEGTNRLGIFKNQFKLNGTAIDMKGNSLDAIVSRNNFISNTFDVVTNSQYNNNLYERNYWSTYKGYDLDRDGKGDVPYRPVNVFSRVTKQIPGATILIHSLLLNLLDAAEKIFPTLIPPELIDNQPIMKPYAYVDRN